ncbi:VCBS domain-containing protein [Bradyrhizobium sp. SZCCHNS2002]|uniref:Npun_F0296 family exosortase-dependent surface protein n=1 Tax=Bradyrhizobium sp. SZCCHNS2002 TaxID=3057302 RepID=UPI0029167FE6|nr:VCBS domain-containing protein [Bradyrhizobium sp. SZCCHNS2002]
MNYAGTSDATHFSKGLGEHTRESVRLDAPPAHAPSDAIVVPDAHFLFNADFKRSGADLILSGDGRELVLHDYFKGEKRAPLASPDGAHLSGDLVSTLTGSVQVSQAGGTPAAGQVTGQVIGHVTKLQGTATAIRNGVSIILHQGDNVEKGDVVQSGSDSTLGITFIDGTVFGLASNARMVLNEMVYDPNGSNNSSLMSLVAGTISFVAGATAKHGDMKVDTPVATMGIRGTAVLVQIDFTVPGQSGTPDAKFQVLVEPDGTTGSYVLFDKVTLQPIAVVNQAGHQINISNGIVTQTDSGLPPDVQKLITDVFSLKFSDNSNPKSTTHFTDVGVLESTTPLKLADGSTAVPTYYVTNAGSSTSQFETFSNFNPPSHMPGKPNAVVLDDAGRPAATFALTERPGKTSDGAEFDTVKGAVNYADVNAGDRPSVSVSFKSFSYQNAQHANLSLNALQLRDIAATAIDITVAQDPNHKNYGTATWTYSVADNAFDFLAAGETLTLTYMVRVDNNFAPSNEYAEIPITITVTGTNDKPVITTGAQSIAFSGGTSVPGGPLTSSDPTSGVLSFTDVDLTDTHTVSVALTSPQQGSIPQALWDLFNKALTASVATDSTGTSSGTVNWSLANLPAYAADFIPAGQKVTLTYTVAITDSQGATTQQAVTVTITGTDEPAVVWIATTSGGNGESRAAPLLLWRDGANWETGHAPTANDDVVIVTDQLRGLTPAFPVTIDTAAFAKSVTMNDYGGGSTPELVNLSTLTIGGTLTVKADARVTNFVGATISVSGQAEFSDQSVLNNAGTLRLADGGAFGADASIANTGTIELVSGALTVLGDLVNANETGAGLIQVDLGGMLALNGGSIAGGTIAIDGVGAVRNFGVASSDQPSDGVLKLQDGAVLSDGELDSSGSIVVSGFGNMLHGEVVTSSGKLELLIGGGLILDQGTSIDNRGGAIAVDQSAKLALNHAGITGGQLTNAGTVALTGYAALIGGTLENHGAVTVAGWGNLLAGETVSNDEAASLTIAVFGALALADTAIASGTVHNNGVISVTGDSTIDGATLDGGDLLVGMVATSYGQSGQTELVSQAQQSSSEGPWSPVTLTLQGGAIVAGTDIAIGHGDVLDIAAAGATLSHVGVDNAGAVRVEHAALLVLEHSTVAGGHLVNAGTVHIETDAATTFDNVSLDNSQGTIIVDDEGNAPVPSTLVLDGNTTITGGLVTVGIVGTLEIAGAGATLAGVHVGNFGALTVDEGATFKLIGTDITGDGIFQVSGTVDVSGHSSFSGTVVNYGTIEITGGTFEVTGSISGTGHVIVDAGATLALDGSSTQAITFGEPGGMLVLGGTSFDGKIESLAVSDKIDLTGIEFDDNPTATYDSKTGILTVSDSDGHKASLTLSGGDYSDVHFAISNDGDNGTLITLDHVPVITSDAQLGSITERACTTGSDLPDTASGVITFTDADVSDTHVAKVTGISVSGDKSGLPDQLALTSWLSLGTLIDSKDGAPGSQAWSFSAQDKAFDYLSAGQSVTLTYTVEIADGHGGVVDTPVTITITGSEDAPQLVGETNPPVQTVVLTNSPVVLATGTTTNTDGLRTETFDHVWAGSPSNNGHGHGNFYSEALHAWFSAYGDAGVVHGGSSGSVPPYLGDGHQDGTNYLSVGAHAAETITFDSPKNTFGLYWGSVDSYNSISFYDGNKLVASYSGDDISPLLANGNQGSLTSNGYVEFHDLATFDKVVLTSSSDAFELDNVSAGYVHDAHVKLAGAITGTLTVIDKDVGDTLTASVIGDAVVKYNGSCHLPDDFDIDALTDSHAVSFDSAVSDGKSDVLHWSYHPSGANLDFLKPGDTLTLTYLAKISDGHGTFGLQPLTVTISGNGSSTVYGTAQNDTFQDVGGGVTIFGKGGNDSFVFNSHFGSATIADFDIRNDTIEFDHSVFNSVQAILNGAHSANSGHDTVITDAAHDTITLKGVTLAQLQAHQNDFHIV